MATNSTQNIVWVTRPAEQSQALLDQINAVGITAINFPVIGIEAISLAESLTEKFQRINDYDIVIFVSRNAVRIVYENYLSETKPAESPIYMAIGQSTAKVLQSFDVKTVLHAGTVADTESLLSMPELQAEAVSEKNVLLVKGRGGRELLYKTLLQRNAHVDVAEVYQRTTPHYDESYCLQLWRTSTPNGIIVTSNAGIDHLVSLTPGSCRAKLYKTPLIVMSDRNAEYAREYGFDTTIQIAKTKDDAGLINAMTELLEASHL